MYIYIYIELYIELYIYIYIAYVYMYDNQNIGIMGYDQNTHRETPVVSHQHRQCLQET